MRLIARLVDVRPTCAEACINPRYPLAASAEHLPHSQATALSNETSTLICQSPIVSEGFSSWTLCGWEPGEQDI